jgi:arylsulfatase A-like enzyme
MKRRGFLKTGSVAAAVPFAARAAAPSRPNFVFFLADDLGWTDLGCYGSSFYESPNLDRLCRESLKFTNAYSAGTVCSPTRASIVTGRYPVRTGCTQFGWNIHGTERCFAQDLTEAGYSTFFTGKWHIGGKSPQEAGFTDNRELDTKNPTDDPKGTRNITENTVDFLKGVKGKPFFAYVNYHAVHIPLKERQDVVDTYIQKLETNPPKPGKPAGLEMERDRENKQIQDDPNYAAVLKVMDDSVGRILETVKSIGADKNTIVIFTSDNGGLSTKPCTSNLPLRAGKGWIYEGGIRVPAIIKWPGTTRPGSVSDVPFVSTDYYPTILELAGLPLRPQDHVDGVSIAGLLQTGTAPKRKEIYWHYPHNHGAGCSPCGAVRIGDYKLVQFFETGEVELYNLTDDLSEMNDLAARMPEKKAELFAKLKAWQQTFPDINYKAVKTADEYNSGENRKEKKPKNKKS